MKTYKNCNNCNKKFIISNNENVFCSSNCRIISKNYHREYREINKEKIQIFKKKYYQKNKNHISIKTKQYRLNNIDKLYKYHQEYYKKNKTNILSQHKKYYKNNKKFLYQTTRIYYKNNRDKINNWVRTYSKLKSKIDNNFKLKRNLRHRLNLAIKLNHKSLHTIELLGCSIEFLRHHLESQFTYGMSWSNYGKWHIDHIRPCASFDLSDSKQQKICFNYKNLQPLWARDNISKGDSY